MADNNTLQLPDGRILGYATMGAPEGNPLFTCHGLPGSRMESYLFNEAAKKLNIKIITADRPGYGLSTPQPHRTLLQYSNDIICLADHLAIDTFNIIGISGGAPCALSCAATIADRIDKIAIVCGLGPLHHTGLTKNMHLLTAMTFWLARHTPLTLKFVIGSPVYTIAKLSPALMLKTVGWFNGGVDRKLLNDPQVKQLLNLNIREAFRQGTVGAEQDMRLYTQPWGFQLAAISKPIDIWHGDVDTVVPIAHSEFVHKQLPHSRLITVPGEAHFSLPIRYAEKILQRINM